MNVKKFTRNATGALAALVIAASISGCSADTDKRDDATVVPESTQSAAPSAEATKAPEEKSGTDKKAEAPKTKITGDAAAALDNLGLRDGVVSRGEGYEVVREGNTLIVVPSATPNATGNQRPSNPVVIASNVDKPKPAPKPERPATPPTGDEQGNSPEVPGGNGGGGGQVDPAPEVPTPPAPPTDPEAPKPPVTPPVVDEGTFKEDGTKFLQTVQFKLLGLINEARAERGLSPLKPTAVFTNSAQKWATDATSQGKWGIHSTDYDGIAPFSSELMAQGFMVDASGKKVTADEVARNMMNGLRSESAHFEAIMRDDITHLGIGVASATQRDGATDSDAPRAQVVIQTGTLMPEIDDKEIEYTNPNQQSFGKDSSGKYQASAPKVEDKKSEAPPAPTLPGGETGEETQAPGAGPDEGSNPVAEAEVPGAGDTGSADEGDASAGDGAEAGAEAQPGPVGDGDTGATEESPEPPSEGVDDSAEASENEPVDTGADGASIESPAPGADEPEDVVPAPMPGEEGDSEGQTAPVEAEAPISGESVSLA